MPSPGSTTPEGSKKPHGERRAAAAASSQSPPPASSAGVKKKRRKVDHACIYCRRSDRPCARCIKRNIAHLCHDEGREVTRKPKSESQNPPGEGSKSSSGQLPVSAAGDAGNVSAGSPERQYQDQLLPLEPPSQPQPANEADVLMEKPLFDPSYQSQLLLDGSQAPGYVDWSFSSQNQFPDIHTFHPSYMFNASEVTNEYNVLNDFLSASLLDDEAYYGADSGQTIDNTAQFGALPASFIAADVAPPSRGLPSMQEPSSQPSAMPAPAIPPRPASTKPLEKAREKYYLTAADPSGSDPPEVRMNNLLRAKYDAGLLRPFNYVNGYARLSKYMESHMQPASRQKIMRQLDKFRPRFRERMQKLTDIQLVLVEMWFERTLMEYDRVFASMAVPACCWRRTGEIFRGNKEMAELIHVPIERLQDGKLAIHEMFHEESLVSYWEMFGAMAFDKTHKALLTSCVLKRLDGRSEEAKLECCFSFMIRRDPHDIPSLIVGNFMPMEPEAR